MYKCIADNIPVCCGGDGYGKNDGGEGKCMRFDYATQDWIDVGTLPSGNTYDASSMRHSKLGLLIASGRYKDAVNIPGEDLWRIDGTPGVLDGVNITVICAY